MAQNREKVLLGIYTHERQKASKLAVFRVVPVLKDETGQLGQIMTNRDNLGQFMTNLDRTGQNMTNLDRTGQNMTIQDKSAV